MLSLKKNICAAATACLVLSGCVVGSQGPFFTPESVVDEPQFYGSWYFVQDIEASDESPVVLSKGKMTIYDDKGVPSDAKITLFKVDDALFMDIFADEGKLKQDLVKDQAPIHLLSRVTVLGPEKISINALDYDWLAREVQDGTIALPFEKAPGSEEDIIFTATPEQWMDFLRKHKDDLQAFPKDGEAPLVRKTPRK